MTKIEFMEQLGQIAKVLIDFPGVEIRQNFDEGYLSFSCYDKISLFLITDVIDLSNHWNMSIECDREKQCLLYLINPPIPASNFSKKSTNLFVKNLKNKLDSYPVLKETFVNPDLGTPDLSFVTINEIVDELDERNNINYVLIWEDLDEHSLTKNSYSMNAANIYKMIGIMEQVKLSLLNKENENL